MLLMLSNRAGLKWAAAAEPYLRRLNVVVSAALEL
jgi:hypothetical protein